MTGFATRPPFNIFNFFFSRRGLLIVMALAGLAGLMLVHDARDFPRYVRFMERIRLLAERIEIPATGIAPVQAARLVRGEPGGPLIVELPSWNGTAASLSGHGEPLVTAIRRAGWNYIRPSLVGGNRTPDGCCSAIALAAVKAATDFALRATGADPSRIILAGESGGGYTALCALMQETVAAQSFLSWVAPTDLAAWHDQRNNDSLSADIRACTGGGSNLNIEEARRRSPLYMSVPHNNAAVRLYAGIHDGISGPVPSRHSIGMFEKLAQARGGENAAQDQAGHEWKSPRAIHVRREAPGVSLIIFEGGHEMLTEQVMADIRSVIARPLMTNVRR